MVAQNIFFYLLAIVMVVSALRVVTTKNVVHAAMFLVLVLAGAAAQFILLAAEFVAATQVLVYIGAVIVLILFGVMLTRARIGEDVDLTNNYWPAGLVTAVALFAVLSFALWDGFERAPIDQAAATTQIVNSAGLNNTEQISDAIFSDYLIAFEAVSVLLLGALVGAIVLAREGLTTMNDLYINQFLLLSAILFCIGVYGVLAKRNAVLVLMSIELILNAVNINLVAFAAANGAIAGSVFALFVIAIAAAEVGVGLAMVLLIYRNRKSVDLDDVAQMKG